MRAYFISKAFVKRQEGAAMVEFAIVAGAFFMLMFGIIEFGLYMFTQVALESAVTQASRASVIGCGTGCDAFSEVRKAVQTKTSGLIGGQNVVVTANIVAAGGAPPAPDICMIGKKTATPGHTNCRCGRDRGCKGGLFATDSYIEYNNVPGYQSGVVGGPSTTGGSGAVVEIEAMLPWQIQFPFVGALIAKKDNRGKDSGIIIMRARTVIRNEES